MTRSHFVVANNVQESECGAVKIAIGMYCSSSSVDTVEEKTCIHLIRVARDEISINSILNYDRHLSDKIAV